MQTQTSVSQESIAATRMLSVTTLKALTIVHANQDILEMALTAQNIVTKILITKTLTWHENSSIQQFFFRIDAFKHVHSIPNSM